MTYVVQTCAGFSIPSQKGLQAGLGKWWRTRHHLERSELLDRTAGTPFLKNYCLLPNFVREPLEKVDFGTHGQVDRWPRPTGDLRHCILGGTGFHERQALAKARSHLGRCTESSHGRARGLGRTSGTIENLVGEWKQ